MYVGGFQVKGKCLTPAANPEAGMSVRSGSSGSASNVNRSETD